MIDNQQSWAFKSKEPKVAIYRQEEKRIRTLYGSKQSLKYKIKLNDQILDPMDQNAQTSPTGKGKLNLGATIEPNQVLKIKQKQIQDKKAKDDIFGTQGKLDLGPGDYQPEQSLTKHKSPVVTSFI